jgi:antirestriction protein
MDSQNLINAALALASSATGWFARELWAAVKELKADLAKLREELPREYVMKEDYRRDIYEIKDMLGKIFDRLDNKADK